MNARDQIFARIRKGLDRQGPLDESRARVLEDALENPQRGVIPDRTELDHEGQVALFIAMAEEAAATVQHVADDDALPKALADHLARHNLPSEVKMAPDATLERVAWDRETMLTIRRGKAEADDHVSVTPAFAAIAETGTLMLASGPNHPSTLNLLPDTHVVVVRENQVVASYEDGWDRLRAAAPGGDRRAMPRTALFVTGPSRSADIEQTLQMGAHGPRRLHILLVAENGEETGS